MAAKPTVSTIPNAVQRLRRGLVLRANSLLVTVYGDALAARRQSVWLGSLIRLLEPFGMSARLVRTSAFRLTADDWFVATRAGRRSYYGLSESGMQRVQHADRRIYTFGLPDWDGQWTIVVLQAGMRASVRRQLKRDLLWESFGQLSPTVFAHPHAELDSLQEIIKASPSGEQVAVLSARSLAPFPARPLHRIMQDTFDLPRVQLAWEQFNARFAPLLAAHATLGPAEAFFVRTLLVHEYRRVLLRDPHLPEAFLPPGWPGLQARRLCAELYAGLLPQSEAFLQEQVETADGPLAPTPPEILRRMGHP